MVADLQRYAANYWKQHQLVLIVLFLVPQDVEVDMKSVDHRCYDINTRLGHYLPRARALTKGSACVLSGNGAVFL